MCLLKENLPDADAFFAKDSKPVNVFIAEKVSIVLDGLLTVWVTFCYYLSRLTSFGKW